MNVYEIEILLCISASNRELTYRTMIALNFIEREKKCTKKTKTNSKTKYEYVRESAVPPTAFNSSPCQSILSAAFNQYLYLHENMHTICNLRTDAQSTRQPIALRTKYAHHNKSAATARYIIISNMSSHGVQILYIN